MANKKDLIGAGSASASAFNSIAQGAQSTGGTQFANDTDSTPNTSNTPNTHNAHKVQLERSRLNLCIPTAYKDYLQEAAYKASTPTKLVSVTEYLCRLIKKDMEEHEGKENGK